MSKLNVTNPRYKVLEEPPTGTADPKTLGLFISGVNPQNIKKVPELLANRSQLEAMVRALHQSPNIDEQYNTCIFGPYDDPYGLKNKSGQRKNVDSSHSHFIIDAQHIINRLSGQKAIVDYYHGLGFKDTALNCKLAKLDQAINSRFCSDDIKDRKFGRILRDLSYGHYEAATGNYSAGSTEVSKYIAEERYADAMAVREHLSQLILDYLYSKEKRNAPDSFIKQYLSAMNTIEERARKEFKILEPSSSILFEKTLREMIRRNKAKNIEPLSKEEISRLYNKHKPLIQKMYEPIIAQEKDLKDFEKYCSMEHHGGYVRFCRNLHEAGVIDAETFEDMAFKSVYRKPALEEYLYQQEAFIKMRENVVFAGYAEETYAKNDKKAAETHGPLASLKHLFSKLSPKLN